jgi:hypothetical protein
VSHNAGTLMLAGRGRARRLPHATINGNSSPQNAPPCSPSRCIMPTSASALCSASAHRVALSRKNCSCLPATR